MKVLSFNLAFFISKIFKIIPLFFLDILWSILSPFDGLISTFLKNIIIFSRCKSCLGLLYIGRGVTIKNYQGLNLGRNISIHANSYIDAAGSIDIGNDVSIAHNTSILSFEHTWDIDTIAIKYNPTRFQKTIIEDDVWIGCGVRVLAGSIIKTRNIIAAGSVIRGTTINNAMYAGVPAKKIKYI